MTAAPSITLEEVEGRRGDMTILREAAAHAVEHGRTSVAVNSEWLLFAMDAILSAAKASEALRVEVERLKLSRSNWRASAIRAGQCPSCNGGDMQEPCTDCLNTGWRQGDNPFDRAALAETRLDQALAEVEWLKGERDRDLEALERIVHAEVPAIPMATGENSLSFNLMNFANAYLTSRRAADTFSKLSGEGK